MKPIPPQVSFPELEKETLAFWRQHKTFERSVEQRRAQNAKAFMFYDGPPFATGLPHYGHLLQGTIKDIVPRYQTMKGALVERRFGWDTHGVPVEMQVEGELGLRGRTDVLEYGVGKFNEACRASVLKYVNDWRRITERLGRWIDFDNDYKTMDRSYMESVWWVVKQLWDAGRVYEGQRIVPYSWRLTTTLSNFEAGLNYKDVQDPAVTVRFKLLDRPGVSVLAWTTTPWTLISNLALCAHPKHKYVQVKTSTGESIIMAEARLTAYFKKPSEYVVEAEFLGKELEGQRYEPLFNYHLAVAGDNSFKVVCDEYVSLDDGTGLVHQAPCYGEDDYRVCARYKIPVVDSIDVEGNFLASIPELQGQNFKEAEKQILTMLKASGLLYKQDVINHSYPFCWRSDTPLMYRAVAAWYVRVEEIRDSMSSNNATVHWVPEFIGANRFGNWLGQARDWNISRNRFWGNPIPVWRCESCKTTECLGGAEELEQRCGAKVADLHSHFIDELTWSCKCGGMMKRIPEVLDCWFESGSMPFAQQHYPFENKEQFEAAFPADFIAEAVDQTRGWFYSLMVLSTAIKGCTPFRNAIVTGHILASDGKKMSKRLKNYPDPVSIMESYGADAMRLYMVNSPVVRGENLRFVESGVKEVVRQVLIPFWNIYSFFTTYADIDGFKPSAVLTGSKNPLDRWAISRLQTLLAHVECEMGAYRLYTVTPELLEFIDQMTNWHLRRSRRRFWSEDKADKQQGYDTLLYVLTQLCKTLAPFLPFVTESMYRNLVTLLEGSPESVHLCDFPVSESALRDSELESEMALVIRVVSAGRALRASANLKVRQPLKSVTVVTRNVNDAAVLAKFSHHILEELNVKQVLSSAEEDRYITLSVKPNLPVLGPMLGKDMGKLMTQLASIGRDKIALLEEGGEIELLGHKLRAEHFLIQRTAKDGLQLATEQGVTVFFDTQLTPELVQEGLTREFVNRVQNLRKASGFEISDRIHLNFSTVDQNLAAALKANQQYVQDETLALEFGEAKVSGDSWSLVEEQVDGIAITIAVRTTK